MLKELVLFPVNPPYDSDRLPEEFCQALDEMNEDQAWKILNSESMLKSLGRELGFKVLTLDEYDEREVEDMLPRGFELYED